ncbi:MULTISPECIES: sulfite exporter TauE/SafE family protein [Halomonas]|uniref:sulfite exporter TauE/SafE family protein n=1 Tax=Halomonas TaxID=2745 RepID=UPI001C94262D|nr:MULTISPECIES: sulfite exporter TauE/SafE family protein [Halomonas]MBY6207591.1 sulfite exporter TauE/SafE family protein [Halomonas sp. DP3Y7-2]MBY6228400.1 sulfite exporter TauE/SafE family protein [Halomonas sp. DP3Y7-1]MCA0916466.1 sulfite exporter TauE/SafE family protein [Halomonas denitrificans]
MNPVGLDLPPAMAAFVFGLLGGAHCIGMCGGIMSALTFAIPPSMRHPVRVGILLLGYNSGRLFSYCLAGAMVASLGSVVALAPGMRDLLQVVASLMLITMALYIANLWKGLRWLEALGQRLWRYLEPAGRRLLPVVKLPQAVALGAIWGWLPCGLVYSMLAWSMAIADPVHGALLMLCFGLGTLPALVTTGVAARQLQSLLAHPATRFMAAGMIVGLAVWNILQIVGN